MKLLVTGANGFVGAWTVRRLAEAGHAVRALDLAAPSALLQRIGVPLDRVEWCCADVGDAEAVARAMATCDAVVHLAGVLTPFCREAPLQGARVNLLGTLHVFEGARRHGIQRVIYASSAGVFGPEHARHPEPTTHYGAFKLACEGSARAWWHDAGIGSLGLRPFVVYGPGRELGASAGISLACVAAVQGRPYRVPFTGRAGMVHVDDVVRVIEHALRLPPDGAHLADLVGEVHAVDAVLDEIRRQCPGAMLGSEGPPLALSPDIVHGATQADIAALPVTPLAEGIARTLEVCRTWHTRSASPT
jgi:nucleoside-diphosphate-sugar epimerase